MEAFLQPSHYINFKDQRVQTLIESFKKRYLTDIDQIRAVFEFVRDEIKHSYDMATREVTRTASEVLEKKHGICYAKSHLFAALLRGLNIPAGFSYQRLTLFEQPEDGFCIHALNTVYVRTLDRWIRLDARGNKEGVNAQFFLDEEKLAFPVRKEYGEKDYVNNYDKPHPDIIQTLESHRDCREMYKHGLPQQLSE